MCIKPEIIGSRSLLLLVCSAMGWGPAAQQAIGSETSQANQLDFTNDIAPIFTKFGCNGGGCHGKSTGRGGFKLSLFGFEPLNDYESIARGTRGRRVFPASPDQSLLLQKATMQVPHGGGRRIDPDGPEYQLLRRWIAASTPWGRSDAPRIARLEVQPATHQLGHREEVQLRVTAVLTDDSRRDVTRLTRFRVVNAAVASIDPAGQVTAEDRTGDTAIVAQYQGQAALSHIVVPNRSVSEAEASTAIAMPESNFIDAHIIAKLKQLRVPPSTVSSDAAFLRRATLQIAGRLPTMEEMQAFQSSDAMDRREQLVERLMSSGDYADHFAQKWCDVLRIKRRGQKDRLPGTIAFHRWLRGAIATNIPFDQIVREIITASGDVSVNPPAQWYAEVRYLDRYVDDMSQVFLGIRIGCARCHHHPFEKFSQQDYYGLAAFFARVDRKGGAGVAERRANEAVFVKPTGEVKHPLTGKVVAPCGLGAQPLKIAPYQDARHDLVDWMAGESNPYFARAFVNRMWAHFFGCGLVDPLDDLRETNPATNEALLDELAAEFTKTHFDMKHVIRLIACSTTYQLASLPNDHNLEETQNHSRFYPQRITAEVLLDAIDQVTQVSTAYGGLPAGTRALQLPDEGYSNDFLRLFGRPPRESACECERSAEPSLSQSLFVMNNSFFLGKVTSSKGFAARLAADKRSHEEKIQELFQTVLTRAPLPYEIDESLKYIAAEADARKAYGNLLWALINTKEFLYIH